MSALVTNPKKPKVEGEEEDSLDHDKTEEDNSKEEQKEALEALIEHRAKEVHHIKERIASYHRQLVEAEKSLRDSETKLAHLQDNGTSSWGSRANQVSDVEDEHMSKSPKLLRNDGPTTARKLPQSKKEAAIGENSRAKNSSVAKPKHEKSSSGLEAECSGNRDRGTKRKLEQKEHKELIRLIGKSSSPCAIKSAQEKIKKPCFVPSE